MAEYSVECGLCLDEDSKRLIQCRCGYCVCFDCQHMMKKLYCPNCNEEVIQTYIYKLVAENDPLVVDHFITKRYRYDAVKENEYHTNKLRFETMKESILKKKTFYVNIVNKCPKCKKNMIYNSNEPDIHRCTKCDFTVCSSCEEEHPKDQKCNQIVVENLKELRKISRKCPGCFTDVSKENGCDHMRCLSCGTQFDWRTGRKHKDYDYLSKRDNNVVYKPGSNNSDSDSESENLEIIDIKPITVGKKSKLTNQVSDFIIAFKDKIENNIKIGIEKLIELIEQEYKNDRDESSYETILSRIPLSHKKNLYDNLLVSQYIGSIGEVSEERIDNLYQNSPLPQCYKISWNAFIKFITKTTVVEKLSGNIVKNNKDNVMIPLNYKQDGHIKNILEKLRETKTCIDTSPAGSGKTYTALLATAELDVKKIFIICPPTMVKKWTEVISSHKQTGNMEFIIKPFSSLIQSSLKNSGLILIKNVGEKIVIHLSDSFKKWLKDCMVIMDEIHNIKSPSSFGFKFISSLSTYTNEKNIPKICMSATPTTCMRDSLSCIKKIISDDGAYNKRLILKFPRFMRFTFTEEDDKLLRSTDGDVYRRINSLQNVITYLDEHKMGLTYILKSFRNFEQRTVTFFGRSFIKEFETQKFLEILKNIVILEKYVDFRSDDFWFENFFKDVDREFTTEQERLLLLDQEVIERDIRVISDLPNANGRFNGLVLYFMDIYKQTHYGKKEYSLDGKPTLVQLLQYFFFLYGVPIRFCTYAIMKQLTREKIVTLVLNKHIVNIKNVPDDGEGFIDHSENLKLYKLKLEMNHNDEEKMNKIESEFTIKEDDKILRLKLQNLAKVVINLQLSESILSGYVYDIAKHVRSEKRNIVIGFSYNNTADMFMEKCKEDKIPFYLINASVKNKQEVIDKFQRESGCFLLVNLSSLNTGVDLDDKTGDCKRYVFIIPNYDITKLTQFMFRFQRVDSKSNSKVFIITNQLRIIRSMNAKLNFIKNFETSFSILNRAEKIDSSKLNQKYS